MVCFQNVFFSSDVQLMKAIKTLQPTKYILGSCPENNVPFHPSLTACKFSNLVQFSPGYLLTQMSIQSRFLFWWMHIACGHFTENVFDWQFSCSLQIMERLTLNRFFLRYTLLNLFLS